MIVTPLGSKTGALKAVEINYNYVSFGALLRHLRRLPGCTILRKHRWLLTDDYWADFQYRGYVLSVQTPFVDYWVERPADCPETVFVEVVEHLRSFRPWLLNRWAAEWSLRRRGATGRPLESEERETHDDDNVA